MSEPAPKSPAKAAPAAGAAAAPVAATEAKSSAAKAVPAAGYSAQTAALSPKANGSPTAAAKPSNWSAIVRANFKRWDKDGDGWLSMPEINALLGDASIKGPEAAALAALHKSIADLEELSNDEIGDENDGVTAADLTAYERGQAGTQDPSVKNVEAHATNGKAAIVTADTVRAKFGGGKAKANSNELFPNGVPSLAALKQGKLGDCYFLSAVASVIARDPGALARMITRNVNGQNVTSYTVTFPGSIGAITVAPPTDAEIARYSSSGMDGLWLPVMEKAYGQVRGGGAGANTQEAIGEGGQLSTGVEAITGHSTDTDLFAFTSVETTTAKLTAAFKGKSPRIVTAGIGGGENALGLPHGHAYSVIGFDGAWVTLRNPWGFLQKSTAQKADGFEKLSAGQFKMTVPKLDSVFEDICYEQAR